VIRCRLGVRWVLLVQGLQLDGRLLGVIELSLMGFRVSGLLVCLSRFRLVLVSCLVSLSRLLLVAQIRLVLGLI
jgi:hypothetical protein